MNPSSVEMLTTAAIFLAGAGAGALGSYLRDRRLLRLYRDLNQQLARALQLEHESPLAADIAAQAAVTRAAAKTEVAPLAEAARERIQRPRAS